MYLKTLRLDEIHPYERNPRINDKAIQPVMESIQKDGYRARIIVDKNGVIIAGHTRYKAMQKLGWTEAEVWIADDMTEEQIRDYRVRDNYTAGFAEWDFDLLQREIEGLDFDMGAFGFPQGEECEEPPEPEVTEDNFDPDEDVPEETDIQPGDIFLLGRHRLMCGDSTDIDDVLTLMGGAKADMFLTDPPYNVDYHGSTGMTIKNDSMEDGAFRAFLIDAFSCANTVMRAGAAVYIWHADSEGFNFRAAMREVGWKLRQTLIWVKNAPVLGRQDYLWKHEPCQPAGTMVWTPDGDKPIETLKDGDRVISFDTYSGGVRGYRDGLEVKTASRHYTGTLYGVKVGDKQTWATDNHEFSVRFNPETAQMWCTYLMCNEKGWWRVGVTRTYDARGFGLKHRVSQEHANAAWLIDTFESQADAQMGEQLLATKYGIPYTHWELRTGLDKKYNQRTQKQIQWLYDNCDLKQMAANAERMLTDYGRSIKWPLVTEITGKDKYSRRATARINACNLIPGLMMVPIPSRRWEGEKTFHWAEIDAIDHRQHDGMVYSLAVDRWKHYIADGIVTHNCLYAWKEGTHYFTPDRTNKTVFDDKIDIKKLSKQEMRELLEKIFADKVPTSVIYEDKPLINDLHPTMKPIKLMARLIVNSSKPGWNVLDLFGGSGSTLMACEQLGRTCFTMELDPRYVKAILGRFAKFTGTQVYRIEDGVRVPYDVDAYGGV